MEANGLAIWDATQTQYVASTTPLNTWTLEHKVATTNNLKDLDILLCALDKN